MAAPKALASTIDPHTHELCKVLKSSDDIRVRCARAVLWAQDAQGRQVDSITLCVEARAGAYTYLPLQAFGLSSKGFEDCEEQAAVTLTKPFVTVKFWRIVLDWVDRRPLSKLHLLWRGPQHLLLLQTQLAADDAQQQPPAPLPTTAAAAAGPQTFLRTFLRELSTRVQDMWEAVFGVDPELLQQAREAAAADAESRRLADIAAQRELVGAGQQAAAVAAAQAAAQAEAQAEVQAQRERAEAAEAGTRAAQQAADAASADAAEARAQAADAGQQLQQLQAEARQLNLPDCVICWLVHVTTALLPCGHMCVCPNCAVLPDLLECPLCRTDIAEKKRVYIAGTRAD
jgi:Zinc finger, C3HC4 type (RING finger)